MNENNDIRKQYDEVVYSSGESLEQYEEQKREMQSGNYLNQMRQAYGTNENVYNNAGYKTNPMVDGNDVSLLRYEEEREEDQEVYSAEQEKEDVPKKNQKNKARKKNKKSGGFAKTVKKGVSIVAAAAVFGCVTGVSFNMVTNGTLLPKTDKQTESETFDEDLADTLLSDFVEENKDTEASEEEKVDVSIPITNAFSDGAVNSPLDVSDIADSVMPSVVAITIKGVEEVQNFFGQVQQYEVEGSGSGIIVGQNDTELLIVTNNHVVSGAETVSVQFIDDEVYEAKVKGTDSDNDLAIIEVDLADINTSTLDKIKIAAIGSSDDLKIGEQVVAIGNALGYGQSVTTGIVSAKDRVVDTNATPLIQTDAAINPGNSGGALLNMKGEVIGINSSKYASTEVEGMGYAIPISQVEEILDGLMNRETREKVDPEKQGYLGISCSTIDAMTSEMYGIPEGVYISEVTEGGAAEKAGLKKKYVIKKVDGVSVSTVDELVNLLQYYEAGEVVEITYMVPAGDEYEEKTTNICLGKKAN